MFNIDTTKYKLLENNYNQLEQEKKYIILGNTMRNDMKHFYSWVTRYNGEYKKTAHYTITKNGEIINHFDDKYYSDYFNDVNLNKNSVIILLENEGYLINKENSYINWFGDIYKGEVYQKRWRGYEFWDKYTDNQLDATVFLINNICNKLGIAKNVVNHNIKIDISTQNNNIFYKSNIDRIFFDLNPSWEFEKFKNKIENN